MLGRGGKSLPRLLWVGGHLPGGRLRPSAVFILFPPTVSFDSGLLPGPHLVAYTLGLFKWPVGAQLHLQEAAPIRARALPGR